MGQRATAIADRIADRFEIRILFREGRRGRAATCFLAGLRKFRPRLCCVFDHAFDGVLAATLHKRLTRTPWILDTGDDIIALGKAIGRGRVAMFATRWLDRIGFSSAAHVVVRGQGHIEAIANRASSVSWIPDGVSVSEFMPNISEIPNEPSHRHPLTIGVMGSCIWSEAKQMCYGSELVEAIHQLQHRFQLPIPIRGELIGDGSGIAMLKTRCEALGISKSIKFLGRRPYAELPTYIRNWHIGLSTQTNDAVGRVRTTGKLPLYLASGRFVLASRVGEAARILPDEMLIDYSGELDMEYPSKLARRISELVNQGTSFRFQSANVDLAKQYFDYDKLAETYSLILQAHCG